MGWEYSKVVKYDENYEPESIEGPDGGTLVFYEEWEIMGKDTTYYEEPSDEWVVYLLPVG